MTRKPKHPRNFCAAHPSQVSLLQDTDEPKGLKGRGKEKRADVELQPIPTSRPDFKMIQMPFLLLRKTMVLWYFTFGVTTTAGGMCCAARLRLRVDWLACWLSAVLAAVTTLSCLISPPQTARRSGHRAPFCKSLFAHSKR